jgi:putative oxidoreductase
LHPLNGDLPVQQKPTIMSTYRDIKRWGDHHHPRWFVILRVALGVALFIKGIAFMNNNVLLKEMFAGTSLSDDSGWLPILITWMNLLGGTLLMLGIQTRLVAILELPIVIGAIVVINVQKTLFAAQSELGLAFLALALLIFFIVEGGGPLSLDGYWSKNKDTRSTGTRMP